MTGVTGVDQQNWGVIMGIMAGRPEGLSRRVHNGNRGAIAMGYMWDSLTERHNVLSPAKFILETHRVEL